MSATILFVQLLSPATISTLISVDLPGAYLFGTLGLTVLEPSEGTDTSLSLGHFGLTAFMPDGEPQAPMCCTCGHTVIPRVLPTPVPHIFEQRAHTYNTAEGVDIRRAVDDARQNIQYLTDLSRECQKALRLHEEFEKKHSVLLCSSSRLPNEVWKEVFEMASAHPICTDPDAMPHQFRSASPSSHPLSLSHVNSQWRSMALRMPSIWATIDIFIGTTSFPSSKLNLLNMYLARSSMHLLNVEFDMVAENNVDYVDWMSFPDKDKKAIMQALEILITQSGRWQSALLTLPSEVFSSPIFPIRSAPKLESLTLYTRNFVTDRIRWSPVFLTVSPKLKYFEFDHFVVPRDSIKTMLPWATIETIQNSANTGKNDMPGYGIDDVIEIMRSSPRLENFRFFLRKDVPPSVSALRHNALKNLAVQCRSSSILPLLTTPALDLLLLSWMRDINPDDIAAYFSPECSPRLRKLTLNDCNLNIVLHLLSLSIFQIQKLQLIFRTFFDQDIEILQKLSEDGWTSLAQLESLTIRLCYSKTPSKKLVQSVQLSDAIAKIAERFKAESRSETTLRQFILHVDTSKIPDVALETYKYLKQLHCTGLSVIFDKGKEKKDSESNSF